MLTASELDASAFVHAMCLMCMSECVCVRARVCAHACVCARACVCERVCIVREIMRARACVRTCVRVCICYFCVIHSTPVIRSLCLRRLRRHQNLIHLSKYVILVILEVDVAKVVPYRNCNNLTR